MIDSERRDVSPAYASGLETPYAEALLSRNDSRDL
jgi:hypothetical protein